MRYGERAILALVDLPFVRSLVVLDRTTYTERRGGQSLLRILPVVGWHQMLRLALAVDARKEIIDIILKMLRGGRHEIDFGEGCRENVIWKWRHSMLLLRRPKSLFNLHGRDVAAAASLLGLLLGRDGVHGHRHEILGQLLVLLHLAVVLVELLLRDLLNEALRLGIELL